MGLLNLRSKAEETAADIPDIRRIATETAFHVLHGANPRKRAGAGETFWQFREYQPGDMPRDIDWRQSAKTDRVYIRQKEHHTAQSCLFWLKRNADMGFRSDKALHSKGEAGAVIALCLALLHSRGGEMIGFAGHGRAGHSEKTLREFEQAIVSENAEPLPPPLNTPKRAAFYGVSDFLEPPEAIRSSFQTMAQQTRNGYFIHVLDPAEAALPYAGRIMFQNMSGEERVLINNALDIREEYKKRMDDHIKAVRDVCDALGWQYVLHCTDTPLVDTVRGIWGNA